MSQPLTVRIPERTAERLKRYARQAGRSVSEVGALSIEEWLRQNEFAEIEFRGFGGVRHACIKGAVPVWQLLEVARGYGMDAEKTAAHFRWPKHRVQAGLSYYEAFPDEIDEAIEANRAMTYERMKRLLPQLELIEVPPEAE